MVSITQYGISPKHGKWNENNHYKGFSSKSEVTKYNNRHLKKAGKNNKQDIVSITTKTNILVQIISHIIILPLINFKFIYFYGLVPSIWNLGAQTPIVCLSPQDIIQIKVKNITETVILFGSIKRDLLKKNE